MEELIQQQQDIWAINNRLRDAVDRGIGMLRDELIQRKIDELELQYSVGYLSDGQDFHDSVVRIGIRPSDLELCAVLESGEDVRFDDLDTGVLLEIFNAALAAL